MVTRKPPAGLEGAPYLRARGISVAGLKAPLKVFDGTAREGARGFPTNVNVAAALSLAGIGPDRTQLEIWADPTSRATPTHRGRRRIARFSMTIESVPSRKSAHRPHRAAVHHRRAARAGVGAEGGDVRRLHAQENLAAIEEAGERDREASPSTWARKAPVWCVVKRSISSAQIAAHETQRERLEAESIVQEIKRDGVGADPCEDRRPGAKAHDVDDLVHTPSRIRL